VLDDDATYACFPYSAKAGAETRRRALSQSIDMGIVTTDKPDSQLQYKLPDITSKLRYIAKPLP